jgi:hypothetical protein
MKRREFLAGAAAGLCGGLSLQAVPSLAASGPGELLYNGIRLPEIWPPRNSNKTLHVPSEPFYLTERPAVVPIDVGRQLFVDDFLIESTSLERVYHLPQYHPACPVISPDRPWERQGDFPMAAPYSDGVWFDPRDKLFKLWYMGGYRACTCYAVSEDGIRWQKPELDIQAGTNIVSTGDRDSAIVWLDHEEVDPKRRFKLFRAHRGVVDGSATWHFEIHVSPDGTHWSDVVARSGAIYPRSSVFRNPFRRVWEFGIRKDSSTQVGRCRRYLECADAVAGAEWGENDRTWWLGADTLDIARDDTKFRPQLTNLDAVAYESVVLGFFSLWRGVDARASQRPELNDVCLGFSRDGFHFHRPDRRAFLAMSESEGEWNWGNVQSAGGGCLVVGDTLYFYCSGRRGSAENREAGGSTGLATLRRDGFASVRAAAQEGTLTTRPVTFQGSRLFINAATREGAVRVELLDEQFQPLPGYGRADSIPVSTDSTRQAVVWKTTADLSPHAGRTVRFRFHLERGDVFSFWVSRDEAGKSGGYVAAGGPEFPADRDVEPDV